MTMQTIEDRPTRPWRTPSGVIVGGAYIRPAPMPSGDACLIQRALLDRRTAQQPTTLQRVAGAVWRWL